MAQTFLPGMTNWNTGLSSREIEVFDPQALHLAGVTNIYTLPINPFTAKYEQR